jgi:hypothetical protein
MSAGTITGHGPGSTRARRHHRGRQWRCGGLSRADETATGCCEAFESAGNAARIPGHICGRENGEIHLYWELPSFIAFAEAETALHNDEEFLAILDEMGAAGQSFKSELLTIEITKE